MAPPFPRADTEVDYPIYTVDFDPEDANKLVVAGGGGAGRSGIGNKIVRGPLAREPQLFLCLNASMLGEGPVCANAPTSVNENTRNLDTNSASASM
jgi:hypothetical protein